jgi:ATP/ADP translocase
MAGVAIGSWLAVSATGGDQVNPESFFGMVGPLVAVCVSWLAVQRVHRLTPERVMAAMIIGFAAKFVFFGAYVAVMLGCCRSGRSRSRPRS